MRLNAQEFLISDKSTLLDAMRQLNDMGARRRQNVLLVVDAENRLVGTVTDGDIRRGLLKGMTPSAPVTEVCRRDPIVIPGDMACADILRLIKLNRISCAPVVDGSRHVEAVEYIDDSEMRAVSELVAVVMAGGEGVRLRPLTENTPKPMLKVGGKPILQIILETLRRGGFRRILINVRYLADVITNYFGDGSSMGLRIDYIVEPKPMGTAGSLGLIPDSLKPTGPFLVVNGDLLCTVDFRAVHDFHVGASYDFTLCGRPYETKIPFGYPVIEGDVVAAFREKPVFTHLVNSGIYCVSSRLLPEVPVGEYYDMPDLIRRAIDLRLRVGVFPLREAFHEIGRPESYAAAEAFYRKHLLSRSDNAEGQP
ncbi:MAG: nucleotidyltransferase family protein [Phycisphaerae bacterium]|nr:nucleotidyltransferase family protein [Phycisphaerae bacterium]